MGQRKTPWGGFRWSHADPLGSSSGVMTLGLILADYGQKTGQSGSLAQVAASPKFLSYLRELDRSLVYDQPARGGTTKLTNAFLEDLSRYDVITGYESAALAAAPKNSEVAVIYPSPTSVSEHAVTLLNGDWVSQQQREGAMAFMQFLGGREALQGGLKYYFRPAQSGGALTLSNVLARYSEQGFKDSFSTVELPPYEALNSAAYRWEKDVINRRQF
jgi:ABC-type sulfate transport system substrate-binding protein